LTIDNFFAGLRPEAPRKPEEFLSLDQTAEKFGMALPGTDLLSTSAYDVLTSDVISGAHIGRGIIGGIECEHLAFRGNVTDWQIWIQRGDQPLPRNTSSRVRRWPPLRNTQSS
jgi:hypothetical protein